MSPEQQVHEEDHNGEESDHVEEEDDSNDDVDESSHSAVAPESDFSRQRSRLHHNAGPPSRGRRLTMHRIVGPGVRIHIRPQTPRSRGDEQGRGTVHLHRMTPFSIPQQHYAHVDIGANNNSSIRLPDTQPLPLPDAQQDFLPNVQERFAHVPDELICPICCEFLEDPLGCGHCPSRFCRTCWLRHFESASNCPACRHDVNEQSLQFDDALSKQIKQTTCNLYCRYLGCEHHFDCLADIKQHEEQCPFVKVRCKYAPTGCPWKGVRRSAAHHHEADCVFARLDPFISGYLQWRTTIEEQVVAVRSQTAAMNHMQSQMARRLSLACTKSRANPLHVLEFVVSCLTSPVHCLLCKDTLWSCMIATPDAREQVFHTLALVPVVSIVFRSILRIRELYDPTHFTQVHLESATSASITFWMSCAIVVHGACVLFLCNLNAETRATFMSYCSSNIARFEDVMAVSFTIFFALVIAETDSSFPRLIHVLCTFFATLFVPSMILEFSAQARRPDANRDGQDAALHAVSSGPIVKPLLFGLRIGFLLGSCGVLTTLDAVLFVEYLARGKKWNGALIKHGVFVPAETWLRCLPEHIMLGWFMVRLSHLTYVSSTLTSQLYLPFMDWIATLAKGVLFLCWMNRRVLILDRKGTALGRWWYKQAASRLRQQQHEPMSRGLFCLFVLVVLWGTV